LVYYPFGPQFDAAFQLIMAVAQAVGVEGQRLDQIAVAGSITEQLYNALATADLIICDITHSNPNVMYQLGYAHAKSMKPGACGLSCLDRHYPIQSAEGAAAQCLSFR
jgi:hypothetical protein